MLAFTQPMSRHQRREWWRRQLARQQSGNLSVTQFCRQLGVSLSRFYYWRNRTSRGRIAGLTLKSSERQHHASGDDSDGRDSSHRGRLADGGVG